MMGEEKTKVVVERVAREERRQERQGWRQGMHGRRQGRNVKSEERMHD
jgi:hypothetical protein